MIFKTLFGQMTEEKYVNYLEKTYQKFDIENLRFETLPKNFTLLDTREKNEYNISHIENAIQISYDDFDPKLLTEYSKNDTLILYCSVGYRSSVIAERLKKLGFKNVYNLYGGIFYWANKGHTIVDLNNNKTQRLHGYNKFWSRYIYNSDIEKIY